MGHERGSAPRADFVGELAALGPGRFCYCFRALGIVDQEGLRYGTVAIRARDVIKLELWTAVTPLEKMIDTMCL